MTRQDASRLTAMLERLQADAVMSKFATARECNSYRSAVEDMLNMVRGEGWVLEPQFSDLKRAVHELYFAADWHADRPVDEAALWSAVRDAAGIEPGHAPVPLGIAPAAKSLARQVIGLYELDKKAGIERPYNEPAEVRLARAILAAT